MSSTSLAPDALARRAGPFAAAGFALLVAAVVIALDAVLAAGAQPLREGGGVETASAVLYLLPIAVLLAPGPGDRTRAAPVLLGAMMLRELDFDKRFTSEGVLSLKIFTHDTPWSEKVLGALVLATLVAALVRLVRRRGGDLVRALRAGRPWALYFTAGLAVTVISKSLDGLGRKLASLGIDITEATNTLAGRTEEVMELFIPVLLLMAAVAARRAAAGRPLTRRSSAEP